MKDEIKRKLQELCWKIEELPASELQTEISIMASGLLSELEAYFQPITDEQWGVAKSHLDEVYGKYHDLLGQPGVNAILAIESTFLPLLQRYNWGERSPELYRAMMAVE